MALYKFVFNFNFNLAISGIRNTMSTTEDGHSPGHFSLDVSSEFFSRTFLFAFLHTRTFPLCMTSACVVFFPESDVADGMQLGAARLCC